MRFFPATRTHAPAITRLQPGESILRHGANQIITHAQLKFQKLLCDFGTYNVATKIVGACAATAVAHETS